MSNYLLIFVIITLIVIIFLWVSRQQIEPFYTMYGDINDDISNGNPISLSHQSNPYIDINQKGKRDSIVYQAHGIPLIHEDHPTTPVDKSMFYFSNYSCRPECCKYSSFSCSNGCVCWEAPPQPFVSQNDKISPRS
jgi:hypothetical protein